MSSDYHINIFYSQEDGSYIADIPDLESCSAFGKTPFEALSEVQIAKTTWLQANRRNGVSGHSRTIARRFIRHKLGKALTACP